MRVYALTDLGKRVVKTKPIDSEEMRMLSFIEEGRAATDQELEVRFANSRGMLRRLISGGLVEELTTPQN